MAVRLRPMSVISKLFLHENQSSQSIVHHPELKSNNIRTEKSLFFYAFSLHSKKHQDKMRIYWIPRARPGGYGLGSEFCLNKLHVYEEGLY